MSVEEPTAAEIQALLQKAREVRQHSYSPYSGYQVGAALLSEDGRVFVGANVENSSYPVCQCAERSALGAAVSSGARKFKAIAIVTELDQRSKPGAPCGACRQALSEFGLRLRVYLAGPEGGYESHTLGELLPHAFSGENLE